MMPPQKLEKLEAWMRERQKPKPRDPKGPVAIRAGEPLPPITNAPGVRRHPNSIICVLANELRSRQS